jgi:branched-chain amino acid aminotransferase
MQETAKIWMSGELVPWDDARIHIGTHALHYGTGVFEGIRAYATPKGPAVFRLMDHIDRLRRSAFLYHMQIPFTDEELTDAIWDLIGVNELPACYIRPLAYRGYKELGLFPLRCPVEVAIMVWPWGTYLGEEALEQGIRARISSFRKFGVNSMPTVAKASGQYVNSVLAKVEADSAGYDEAILLNEHGFVAEGSGENVFVVRDGVVLTPPRVDAILEGITRDSVMEICGHLGIPLQERHLMRDDLYLADEVFVTGTAAEVTPIRSVDDYEIGNAGEVTRRIQKAYFATVRGEDTPWSHWLSYAPATKGAPVGS